MRFALLAAVGYVIGLFLNRVADALPSGVRLFASPRCPWCGRPLPWAALAGVIADHAGRSGCRSCGARRPWRSIVVEIGTAAVFVLLGVCYNGWQLVAMCAYFAAFILTTVTDLEHRLIFDVVTLPAIALALVGSLAFPKIGVVRSLIGGVIGFGVFLLLAFVARKREGLGGGDVTLAGLVGAAVGFPSILVAIVVTIIAGGVGALVLLLTRRVGRRSHMPYGPFLVIGGVVALLAGRDILIAYLSLYAR